MAGIFGRSFYGARMQPPPFPPSASVSHWSRRALMRTFAQVGAGVWLWQAGCASPPVAAPRARTRHGKLVEATRFESTPWSFSTNAFVVEGPTGLILIDTQFLTSEANAFADAAEAAFGKKIELAIALHANPDKFNGTAALQARGIRVVTSAQVKALIPSVHQKRVRAFYERYKPDYPKAEPSPESFGDQTTTITAGGVRLVCHVMGAGCSEAHVVVTTVDAAGVRHLFAGDLLANGAHSWLEIGKSGAWLSRIDEMKALAPHRVYPGRGPIAAATLLDEQARYLAAVREEVAAVAAADPAGNDPTGVERAIAAIVARYPRAAFKVFLRIGVPAELKRARLELS